MPNHQLLDNITHKDLRVISGHHPRFGDTASYTNIFCSELRQVQGCYPIFFRKNTDSAQFEAIALFGFASEENLFLDEAGWHAPYIPLTIQRRPFLIGFAQQDGSEADAQALVHIDMDSPRVSLTEGEPVFLAQGGQSPLLQQASAILQAVYQGHQQTRAFIDCLLQYDLIEAVTLQVTLDDGSRNELGHLYTINEDQLAALDSNVLGQLHQQGYLQHIYMILASMAAMPQLIEKKNRRL
ncbi:SapC family protein [Rheinheimera sp. NSM]|uniref:SapC family protein n=1 Tax=Rheinheimera sp. NSM TaxID=3457884 RepID=UPI0040355918